MIGRFDNGGLRGDGRDEKGSGEVGIKEWRGVYRDLASSPRKYILAALVDIKGT